MGLFVYCQPLQMALSPDPLRSRFRKSCGTQNIAASLESPSACRHTLDRQDEIGILWEILPGLAEGTCSNSNTIPARFEYKGTLSSHSDEAIVPP